MSKLIYDEREVGTTKNSYNKLTYKPSINKVELIGNKTSSSLSMYTKEQVDKIIADAKNIKVEPVFPRDLMPITLYYIGTHSPFHVYYVDAFLEVLDLGLSEPDTSDYLRMHNEDLTTDNKDVVPAINELHDDVVGDPAQSSIVGGGSCVRDINKIKTGIGTMSKLTTSNKSSVVNAINELDKDIGNTDDLQEDVFVDLVNTVNNIYDIKCEVPTKMFKLTTNYPKNTDMLPYVKMLYERTCVPIVYVERTDGKGTNVFRFDYRSYMGDDDYTPSSVSIHCSKMDIYPVSGAPAGKQRFDIWITIFRYRVKTSTGAITTDSPVDLKYTYDFTIA